MIPVESPAALLASQFALNRFLNDTISKKIALARKDLENPPQPFPQTNLIQKINTFYLNLVKIYEANIGQHSAGECGEFNRLINTLERLPKNGILENFPAVANLVDSLNFFTTQYTAEQVYDFTHETTICLQLKDLFNALREHTIHSEE